MFSYDWNKIVLDERNDNFEINYETIYEKKMDIIHSNSFLYDS